MHPAVKQIRNITIKVPHNENSIFTNDPISLSYKIELNEGWSSFRCPLCKNFVFIKQKEMQDNDIVFCDNCDWAGSFKRGSTYTEFKILSITSFASITPIKEKKS